MAPHAASWQSSACGVTADTPTLASESIATDAIRDAWSRNHRSIDSVSVGPIPRGVKNQVRLFAGPEC
jgi:hypothetical protein